MKDSKTVRGMLTAAILVACYPAGAWAQQVIDAGDVVKLVNTKSAQVSADYWTADRKASAVAMPIPLKLGSPVTPAYQYVPGAPVEVPGVYPGGKDAAFAAATQSLAVEPAINGGTIWYSYPPPHTRFHSKFGNNLYPNTTLGKLFFSDGAANYVCSGSVVRCGTQKNLVMTAGHCCSNGAGTYYTNWLFVPACVGTSCATAPFGTWNWESVSVPAAWHTTEDYAYDYCYLQVLPNGTAQEIQDVVGALGFAYNQTQPQHYWTTGWPAQSPFNGARVVFDIAGAAELDASSTPNTIGLGSELTGGSSGGGWIKGYDQGVGTSPLWNGLNSYKYTTPNRPYEMFGPNITTDWNTWRMDPTIAGCTD